MLKFAANTGMLYPEVKFLDRFEACRVSGFKYVEFPFPYAHDPSLLKEGIERAGLELVLFDLPVDDWDSGGRGCAADPYAVDAFRDGVQRAIGYSVILHPKFLTCIVGNRLPALPYRAQREILIDNLRYASDQLDPLGIHLLVEIFNNKDNPDFFITRVSDALSLMNEVNRANFKIQIDTYHSHLMEGDVNAAIAEHVEKIGHIQIADVPGRHQPGTGEIDFSFLFKELERLGYEGYVGLEYLPLGSTDKTLEWLRVYCSESVAL